MLIPFTDAENGKTYFVNPQQVAVVFEGVNPEGETVTMINLLNGNLATKESLLDVVGRIQSEIKE